MRTPARAKTGNRARVSAEQTIIAPTKGWYVGTNMAAAPEGTAYLLENAFPQIDYVRARGGCTSFATGLGSTTAINSVLVYTAAASAKMFAAGGGKIWDVTAGGAIASPAASGFSSDYWEPLNYSNTAGAFLLAANGVDPVQYLTPAGWAHSVTGDTVSGSPTVSNVTPTTFLAIGQAITGTNIPIGTTISGISGSTVTISANATATATGSALTASPATYPVTAMTGLSDGPFAHMWLYKSRIWGVCANSMNAYYLDPFAIGGAVHQFPLGAYFKHGGYLLAGGQWAIDSNSGLFQACIFISSEGEVLMYVGDYPGGTFSLQGQYKIAKPLGRRCLMPAGGDLLIMTEDGIVPMSKVESLDQVALENVAVTQPIMPEWRNAVVNRTGLMGWQILPWPIQQMAVINLPKVSPTDKTQYVANSRTGAWARYVGWDANCFGVFQNNLYFGTSDGRVMRAEDSGSDDGNPYTVAIFPSYSALGAPGIIKQVKTVKTYLWTNFNSITQYTVNVNFSTNVPSAPVQSTISNTTALWDVALWDVDVWPGAATDATGWLGVSGVGTAIAIVVQVTINMSVTPDFRFSQMDVIFETGNVLG